MNPHESGTKLDRKTGEWLPDSFSGILSELAYFHEILQTSDSTPVYRGHSSRAWLLDSTFARNAKQALFGITPETKLSAPIVMSLDYHRVLLNMLLLKFGTLARPSAELEQLASERGLDSWFEFMKRLQQYPEEDRCFIRGTNLLDWTHSPDIALFFANENRCGDGSVYCCNTRLTGRTLSLQPVGEILELMDKEGNGGKALGPPLLFCPPKQIANKRPANQEAVYFAQMDMRSDLESQWRAIERKIGGAKIVVKLVLPAGTEKDVERYLRTKGITREFVFPTEA